MEQLNEEIFEGTVEIVAAAMEEAEVELSAEGGERVGDFFAAIYRRLTAIASGEETVRPAKPGTFEIFEDAKGEYRFRLKAGNGEIIAVSEGYQKKESCYKGIESVRRNAAYASVKE